MKIDLKPNIELPITNHAKFGIYENIFKRIIDFVLSFLAIIVLSPLTLIVAVLVRVKLGSPVIFKQKRPGRNEKIFTLYKFRSMTDERDIDGSLLKDDVRLTSFGKFIRAYSIDELPQLVNIIRGDMSIVGPRALLVENLPYYTPAQRKRHLVKPGLTNLVAINGRNDVPAQTKFELDEYYVDNMSFLLDIKIIIKTVFIVLKKKGSQLEPEDKTLEYLMHK